MANCKYMLFGQEFVESQGKMMARVFEKLLSRHPEQIQAAIEQFSCLSAIDYNQDVQFLGDAPSAFLNKKTFIIAGRTICIGTSYNMKQKQSYINRLFLLCGEDVHQFQIVDQDGETPIIQSRSPRSSINKKEGKGGIRYRLFGKDYQSSQAEMMYFAFEEILLRKPELMDWAVEDLHCASWTDYTLSKKEKTIPPQFRSCRLLQIAGKNICIGSGYNLKAKLDLIGHLRKQAGLPKEILILYPIFDLTYWQKDAIQAVLGAFHKYGKDNKRLGIVSMPTGTGKTVMLAALFSQLLQFEERDFSILLLTSRAALALQYMETFSRLIGQFYAVEIAETRKALADKIARPGTILVSTAQKLLGEGYQQNEIIRKEPLTPYSTSSRLLVVVEEVSYNYFGRTYQDMHARFPNAIFFGLTNYFSPSRRLNEAFGELLYQYSFEQAYQDGLFRMIEYYCVSPLVERSEPATFEHMSQERFFKPKESYTNKAKLMVEWIEQSGKDTFSLLLCNSHSDAVEFYKALKSCGSNTKMEIYFNLHPRNSFLSHDMEIPENAQWNGQRFQGVVIACNPDIRNVPFDLMFLDNAVNSTRVLLTILSSLQRRGTQGKESTGILIDFRNDPNTIMRLLPPNLPVHIHHQSTDTSAPTSVVNTESLEMGLQRLSDELSHYQFGAARETFFYLKRTFPTDTKPLSEELEFLFDPLMSLEKQERNWERHRIELEWKSGLWNLFSKHSKTSLKIVKEGEGDEQEDLTEAVREEDTPVTFSEETSQTKGELLEKATLELFRRLFELDKAESADILEKLRRQRAGRQNGFDITFTYRDRFGVATTCMVECKNYQNNLIRLQDVTPKLVSLQHMGKKVDHWILISPNSQISNELSEIVEQWQNDFRWEPIRDIQFWTQDENVQELLALFPDLYTEFYGQWEATSYKDWSAEKQEHIFKYWKAKLAPVPLLPLKWREYLREPAKLLTQCEGDRATCERYACLYGNYVPMHLLDEEELPIDGTAEEYIHQWLGCPEKNYILLLGDFGDGKTYFTYTLARKIAKGFIESPETGWIPLRFTLSDLRDSPMDCREFLYRRLREFGGTLSEWNDIQRDYKFLIILDGLDEMSLGMNDTAVLENLGRLEELIEQFKGHKLIITSRKMAIYADKIRERILDCLSGPEILHLAPITQRDRLAFLKNLADTPQRKERLLKMQNTHDLLGLAAKPLFLEMMQVLLDDDDIRELDAAGIYQQYTEKVLARKFKMQLRLNNDYTTPERVRANVIHLLEELALCLQAEGSDSISLDDFKKKIGQDNLADMLWSTIGTPYTATDADNRMINRSLLKYDSMDSSKACFCHRSMKEYFVARGLIHYLCKTPDKGKTLLMECSFGYEILEFAGKAILRLNRQEQRDLVQSLYDFAHETKGKANDSLRESYERLGTNSVNLIYYAGFKLQGVDWSGLLLHNVLLSGMDLSGKDFSHSSMRYAHMENANLTGCDLRGCDFTGVQFEKSGQLASFAVDSKGGNFLALYKDGKIRRWFITDGGSRVLTEFKQGYNSRIFLLDDGCEGIAQLGCFQFWHRTAQSLKLAGNVSMYHHTRILDVGQSNALIWQRGTMCMVNLHTGTVLLRREEPEDIRACLMADQVIFVYRKERGVELVDLSRQDSAMRFLPEDQPITALRACNITDTEGLLVIGHKNGSIKSYCVKQGQENGQWEFTVDAVLPEGGASILEVDLDELGGIYASILNGTIIRYQKNDRGELHMDRSYQLEIKCAGAKIDDVYPREQYEILLQAQNE